MRSTPSVILAAGVEEGQLSRKDKFLDKFQELGQKNTVQSTESGAVTRRTDQQASVKAEPVL